MQSQNFISYFYVCDWKKMRLDLKCANGIVIFWTKEGRVKVGYDGTKRQHQGLQSTQLKIYG